MRPLGTADSDFPPYHQDHQGKFLFFSTWPRQALTVAGRGDAAAGRAAVPQLRVELTKIAPFYSPASRSGGRLSPSNARSRISARIM
jgi:hypothetical protein